VYALAIELVVANGLVEYRVVMRVHDRAAVSAARRRRRHARLVGDAEDGGWGENDERDVCEEKKCHSDGEEEVEIWMRGG
jgi:hypothetical protein